MTGWLTACWLCITRLVEPCAAVVCPAADVYRHKQTGRVTSAVVYRNHSCSTSHSTYSDTFLCSTVCLSVVCHMRGPCLNHTINLHVICQVHSWCPVTHCVRWGGGLAEDGEILGVEPLAKPLVLCCHLANTNEDWSRLATVIPPFAKLLCRCCHGHMMSNSCVL